MSVLETFRALQKSAAPNHPALLINDQRKPYTYFHRRGNQLVTVNRIELGMSVRDFWTRVSRSNELAGQPSTKSLDLVVYLDMDVLDPTPENYHEEHDNDYINDSEDSLPVKRARLSEALIDDLSEDDDQDRLLSLSVPELAAFQVRHPGNIE
ncbi:hypothetical protein BDY24DRAFT_419533, partial [Mrakia frigida]|uniref:uncharacterized protein n=1 Tax=Mrakia frigida TaxID=29902 RepID=UPI003FCBFA5C